MKKINKKQLLILALGLLALGLIIVLVGVYGQFFAGADVSYALTAPETTVVQSFVIFGSSMIGASLLLFILLNRVG